MSGFTGATVKVVLKQPQGTVVQGRVREIAAGQSIALEDVLFLGSGTRMGSWVVKGNMIEDIAIVENMSAPSQIPAPPAAAVASPAPQSESMRARQAGPVPGQQVQLPFPTAQVQQTPTAPSPATQRQATNFVDPAILSYGRSPAQQKPLAPSNGSPATPVKSAMAQAAEALPPKSSSPYVGEPIKINLAQRSKAVKEDADRSPQPKASSKAPALAAVANGLGIDGTPESAQGETAGKKKKTRRGLKGKAAAHGAHDPPPVMNSDVSRNGNDMNGTAKRGKGWRQTPLLQPSPQPEAHAGKTSIRKSRQQRENEKEAQNGWATEDATDIQDMGEFDFEANHKLFDKKEIFDRMRQDDTTADEDRLVGHNRLARPGTHGGKNLHPTENVLSPKLAAEDDSSDADTEMNFQTGRSSSRHSTTKHRQPSRQNSGMLDGKHPFASSMSSDRGLSRSVVSLTSRGSKAGPAMVAAAAAASPRPDRMHSPHSMTSSRANDVSRAPAAVSEPHLVIKPSRAPCPVLHPDALEMLQTAAVDTFGLTHEAIIESAARCVAELAMNMFDSDDLSRRPSRTNTARGSVAASALAQQSGPPVIVVLAGNHAAGACAVAAARHLICRKTKIILAEAQYESSSIHDEHVAKQTLVLKKMLHSRATVKRGPWKKASNYIKNLSGPPAVIIDALLAGSTYDSLHGQSQSEAREMIDWANRSRAPVLSLASPSGVSALDGSATIVEGEPLAVRPDRVLALGAPVQGLLDAMKAGERWDVLLADVGVNVALKSEEAVAFGREWVVGLQLGGEAEV